MIVGLLLDPFQMILLCIEILVNNNPLVSFTGMRDRQVCVSGVYIPISPFLSSDPMPKLIKSLDHMRAAQAGATHFEREKTLESVPFIPQAPQITK